MKIFVVADSIACPREIISTEQTWLYKLMDNDNKNVYFTSCFYGKSSDDAADKDMLFLRHLKPDVTILQVGIVDCCKRVCSRKWLDFICKIPLVRGWFHRYSKKNHYKLTSKSKHRVVNINQFNTNIDKIIENITNVNGRLIILAIAGAGEYMQKQVYKVNDDIDSYNAILQSKSDNKSVYFTDPYNGYDANEYTTEDGHHLNDIGQNLVYNNVKTKLNLLFSEMQ